MWVTGLAPLDVEVTRHVQEAILQHTDCASLIVAVVARAICNAAPIECRKARALRLCGWAVARHRRDRIRHSKERARRSHPTIAERGRRCWLRDGRHNNLCPRTRCTKDNAKMVRRNAAVQQSWCCIESVGVVRVFIKGLCTMALGITVKKIARCATFITAPHGARDSFINEGCVS